MVWDLIVDGNSRYFEVFHPFNPNYGPVNVIKETNWSSALCQFDFGAWVRYDSDGAEGQHNFEGVP